MVIAAKAATMATFRKARVAVESTGWAIDRTEWVIFPSLGGAADGVDGMSNDPVPRFSVAKRPKLCHKRGFIARLIKGCRGDARADCFISEIA
ncbi:MAG: hypothetical protein KGK16_06665 [Bradyrhizobium sp.]|nr:hypothetical protein [Bradyrhizobium sp.]